MKLIWETEVGGIPCWEVDYVCILEARQFWKFGF